MKEISKFVRDYSLKQKLKDCSGIGTEATRASIIEKLQSQKFLKLDNKFLLPTDKAKQAVKILPTEISFPDLTAVWENLLSDVANKKISLDIFYQKQLDDLKKFVDDVKTEVEKLPPPTQKNKTYTCPHCGQSLVQLKSKFGDGFYWQCENKNCKLTLVDVGDEPFIKKCPVCGNGFIVKKNGKRGTFWACDNFPDCKKIFKDDKNGLPILEGG